MFPPLIWGKKYILSKIIILCCTIYILEFYLYSQQIIKIHIPAGTVGWNNVESTLICWNMVWLHRQRCIIVDSTLTHQRLVDNIILSLIQHWYINSWITTLFQQWINGEKKAILFFSQSIYFSLYDYNTYFKKI